MPTITGLTRAQAESAITSSGLKVGAVTTAASADVAQGRVISQDPQNDQKVDPGSTVDFVVSAGKPARSPCRTSSGRARTLPPSSCEALGLRVVLTQRDADDPKDQVVEMQPPSATRVADGSKVTLFWSDGPEQVPSVVGKTEAEATQLIEDAGFKVSRVTDSSTKAKKGTVLQQSPSAGQSLNKGSTVTIVVSTYEAPPKPTPTPTPTAPAAVGDSQSVAGRLSPAGSSGRSPPWRSAGRPCRRTPAG